MKALYGRVSNVRPIASQGVSRIEIEVPIECHVEATAMLFGRDVLVTLSPTRFEQYGVIGSEEGGDVPVQVESPKAGGERSDAKLGPLCRSAVVLCQDEQFRRYVAWCTDAKSEMVDERKAAEFVRLHCGVASRKDLDGNQTAKALFRELMGEYREWLQAEMT